DPETRTASYRRPPIHWAEHRHWLLTRLADPTHLILLAEEGEGCPVGTIRFQTEDGWRSARLSYLVAPEARGCGLSTPLVIAGMERLREQYPRVAVWAEVMRDNARSLGVFQRLGWKAVDSGNDSARFWSQ